MTTLARGVWMLAWFRMMRDQLTAMSGRSGNVSRSMARALALAAAVAGPLTAVSTNLQAAIDTEQGLPLTQVFSPAAFDSPATPVGAQAFDIDRAVDGALLVSNNEGLLRLDGTGWRTWNPIRGTILATATRGDGRVFIGGVDNLGYFDRFGSNFVSLQDWSKKIGISLGEFWTVLATDELTWFVDRENAFRWDGTQLELVYHASGETRQGVLLGGDAVVLDSAAGLMRLTAAAGHLIEGSEILIDSDGCVLGATDSEIAVLCRDGVLRLWSADEVMREIRLNTDLISDLENARPSALTGLTSGGFAVATRQRGLYLLDEQGELQGHLSQANGLGDARTFRALSNGDDGLWLARDYGLAMIEWPGQVSRFDIDSGLPRTPQGVGRLDGRMYVATSVGVFRLEPGSSGFLHAEPFALVGSNLFEMAQAKDTLFVTSTEGLFALDGQGTRLLDPRLSYVTCVIEGSPTRLIVGGDRGAWVMERVGNGWRVAGDIPGIGSEVRRIVADGDSAVWLSSRSSRQLFRVSWTLEPGAAWTPDAVRVEDFSNAADISPGPVRPLRLPDGLRFASASGLFRFDADQRRFIADAALNTILPRANGDIRAALALDARRVVMVQHDRYRMLQRDAQGGWTEQTSALARIPRGAWPRALYQDANGTLWITTSEAVYRHRPELQSRLPGLPPPRVELEHASGLSVPISTGEALQLGTGPQPLKFSLASSVYVGAEQLRFRSRLLPLENEWSIWSTRSLRELGFVPGGDFVFEVQARDIFDRTSAVSRVEFHLDKPWHQRGWAYLLYALLLAAMVWVIVRLRDRQLRVRAQALETQVRERTRALEQASVTDQLTGLRNRRYFDIATREVFARHSRTLVALIDLDHFKQINDSHGHFVGDQVLVAVASRLTDAAPGSGTLFRWGGEEFLLLAPLSDDLASAATCVHHILHQVGDSPMQFEGSAPLTVTCSIGWDLAEAGDAESIHESLRRADSNLYAAKHGGRDRALGPQQVMHARAAAS
jgi:diguanylate cyclase (GGDEF)-like protein